MKFSFIKLTVILTLGIVLFSCSKDGGSNELAASSTGKAGSLSKFAIVGDYLYVVDNSTLYTYDIRFRTNPIQSSTVFISGGIETIYPYKNNLFIGSTTGMFIYSLDQPGVPEKMGEASHVRSCDPVVANDYVAYVTLKGGSNCGPATSGLYVHDVTNVLQPRLIKVFEMDNPEGLALDGDILYVCCNNDGLKVMNVSNPSDPFVIRTVNGYYFKDAIAYDNLLICYVSTGIMIYDITDRSNPVAVKFINN